MPSATPIPASPKRRAPSAAPAGMGRQQRDARAGSLAPRGTHETGFARRRTAGAGKAVLRRHRLGPGGGGRPISKSGRGGQRPAAYCRPASVSAGRQLRSDRRSRANRRNRFERRRPERGPREGVRRAGRSFGRLRQGLRESLWLVCPQPCEPLLMKILDRDFAVAGREDCFDQRCIGPVFAGLVALISARAFEPETGGRFGHGQAMRKSPLVQLHGAHIAQIANILSRGV